MTVFFTNWVRNIIKKAVSICLIIPQNREVKKIQLHIIDQSFEHNGKGISDQKSWKALMKKRRCTLHASMVSEGFANFIPKEDQPANLCDVNPLETIWIIVDEATYKDPALPNTGRAKTVTTLRREECDFVHALGARTFYTSPLRKCQKTYRKTFWLLKF